MNEKEYKLLHDAYYGTGGFKNGNYLIAHIRESENKLDKRKENAYYLNYVSTVVNSHVDPIFRKEPMREWSADGSNAAVRAAKNIWRKITGDVFQDFINDVDTNGTYMTQFMKRAARKAKLYAVAFIVVDNFRDQPTTLAEAMNQRKFPYAYIVKPSRIRSIACDRLGKLTSISYTEKDDKNPGQTNVMTWTQTTWTLQRGGTTETGVHNLGVVPVVALMSRDAQLGDLVPDAMAIAEGSNMLPDSEFYQIARTNLRLYNICSEIDENLRNQAFSILVFPNDNPDTNEMVLGTDNVLVIGEQVKNMPTFIAPQPDPVQLLQAERKTLVEEIYRMASLSHVTGVQQQQSGVAKAWDFDTTNQVLAGFAGNIEQAEIMMMNLFAKWMGKSVIYNCAYSRDFGIVDVLAALQEAEAALQLGIGGKFDTEVKKKAASVYLSELDDSVYDEVIKDIEDRAADSVYVGDDANNPGQGDSQQVA